MPDSCPLVEMPRPATPLPGAAPPPPLRVLLVEDDVLTARALCRALRLHGMDLLPVRTVEAALRVVAGEPAFDAIVCDLLLPGAGGEELARRLRQPRLIALSGDPHRLPLRSHFDARLRKPCAPALLAAAIRG